MPFEKCALEIVPRLLGLMDRRPEGATAGCFDRPYWRYKLTDFPSAWFQNGTEMLAWLACVQPGPWHGETLRTWAEAALDFSLSLVAEDGSVAEAYPYERGFCATAFLASHLGASIRLLNRPPEAGWLRMGRFLIAETGRSVPANQIAAAALACFRMMAMTQDTAFDIGGRALLRQLEACQHAHGGFWEYGDGDVGYQTVTLSLLAQMEAEGHPALPGPAIRKALNFVEERVGADGGYDYSGTSRHTQYLYPFGLAYFGSPALSRLKSGLEAGYVLRPAWMDDRYVADLAIDHFRTWQWAGL